MSPVLRNGVHQRLAAAVTKTAEHSAKRHRAVHLATVMAKNPWRVELHSRDLVLTEGTDLVISQWVRFYDICWGVKINDNALVTFQSGHYVWHDVVSDTDCSPPAASLQWFDPD